MKFCTFSVLVSTFVSLVAALPRYPPRLGSSSPLSIAASGPEKQVTTAGYVELVTIATSAFSGVLLAYGSILSPLSSLWNVVQNGIGSSHSHEFNAEILSAVLLPDVSHPSGHGKCAEDQFWFGPKQTCVGGTGSEDFVRPPAGYYCPVDWSFSNSLGCCMPHTLRAISKNDCGNGDGTWDLIRVLFSALMLTSAFTAVTCLRLTTWNLRYDSQPNNITVTDSIANLPDRLEEPQPYYADASRERPWSTRRIGVAALLEFQGSSIISFQEALVRQVRDLKELLGDNWDWVGVGRDDGKERGEFSPIFFNKSVVQLKSWDTFWLTNTPFDVSKYPGAGSYRICTVAHLSLGGKDLTLLNTHFDDPSDAQRRLAASLILHRAKYEASVTKAPVFVNGDFNSPAKGTDNGAYKIFTGELTPVPINATFAEKFAVPEDSPLPEDFTMIDTRGATPREKVFGHFATYTGFSNPGYTSPYGRIDFVFGGSHVKWQSVAYKTDEVLYDDGVYLSDHRPVTVDLTL